MLLTEAVEANDLAHGRYGDSLRSVGESDTQPSNWEVDTLPPSYRRPSEIFVANV